MDEHWRAGPSLTSSSNVSYEHNSTVDLYEQLLLSLVRLPQVRMKRFLALLSNRTLATHISWALQDGDLNFVRFKVSRGLMGGALHSSVKFSNRRENVL